MPTKVASHLAAEDIRQCEPRNEPLAIAREAPSVTAGGEASSGDKQVRMDVVGEQLCPGVQDGKDARLGTKVTLVAGQLQNGLRGTAK